MSEKDREEVLLVEYAERMTQTYFGGNEGVTSPPEESKALDLLRLFRAEAVQAERERCEAIVTEEILEYDCDFTGLVNSIVSRILSDDQEASE